MPSRVMCLSASNNITRYFCASNDMSIGIELLMPLVITTIVIKSEI